MIIIVTVNTSNEIGRGRAGVHVYRERSHHSALHGSISVGLGSLRMKGIRYGPNRIRSNKRNGRRGSRHRGIHIGLDLRGTQCPVIDADLVDAAFEELAPDAVSADTEGSVRDFNAAGT